MADEYDDLFNEQEDTPLPKKLRAKIDELSDQLKELKSENEKYKTVERERELTTLISEKGLNPKVAKFVPKDIDASGLDAWISENADVFGGQPIQQKAPEPSADEQRISMFEGEMDQVRVTASGDIESQLAKATSIEEIERILGQR